MPRLKFDLTPITSEWRQKKDRDEHNAGIAEFFARHHPDEQPGPCDCGYWADDLFVHCSAKDRVRCKRDVRQRLEQAHRHRHLNALKKKREFPALAPNTEKGQCWWCKKPMVHGRVYQRAMHDGRLDEPNCRYAYETHTRLEVQQQHLLDRDGLGCKSCGAVVGRWGNRQQTSGDRLRAWGEKYLRKYPETVWAGEFQWVEWQTGLEVDHFIALAVAWEVYGDEPNRFRWFFSPAQLRLLCSGCHKLKTKDDMALLREIRARGKEWGRLEIIRRLNEARLLKRSPA